MSYKFLCYLLTLDLSIINRSQFFVSQESGGLDWGYLEMYGFGIKETLFPIFVGFFPLQCLPLLEANSWCSRQANCQNKTKQDKI